LTKVAQVHVGSADQASSRAGSRRRMTQAERTAVSDRRMFDAAIALILERGTHNTTLKDVGERAGYSRGLASNRFGSKEALFRKLVHDFNGKWAGDLERAIGSRTGLAAIMAALECVEQYLVEQPHQMKAMYTLWYESISGQSELRRRLADYHEAYRRDARRWVEEGIAEGAIRPQVCPSRFAVQFCSFIFGTIYQWLVAPDSMDVRQTFQDYRDSVQQAVARHRNAAR
jgi:AcrR family transcriptional regulator